jgi:hypothetical protein
VTTPARAMGAYVFPPKRHGTSRFTLTGAPTEVLLAGLSSHIVSLAANGDQPTPVLVIDGLGLLRRLLQGDLETIDFSRRKGSPFRPRKTDPPGRADSESTPPTRTQAVNFSTTQGAARAGTASANPRATMSLQHLLTLCAGSQGGHPGSTHWQATACDSDPDGLGPPPLGQALADSVAPLRRAVLAHLHALQRVTGCAVHVVLPTHDCLSLLPPEHLGPSIAAARRFFWGALRKQSLSAQAGTGSAPAVASSADPFHLTGVAASDEGGRRRKGGITA